MNLETLINKSIDATSARNHINLNNNDKNKIENLNEKVITNDENKNIALCINCYHNTNINKFIIHLSSLLVMPDLSKFEYSQKIKQFILNKYEFLSDDKINNLEYIYNFYTIVSTYEEIENKNIQFNNLNECIEYLLNHNFRKINYNNLIHVAFYCDGISGYKYRDLEDFKNRFDIPHFNELFKDKIILPNQVNKLLYFIYSENPNLFPEIIAKANELYKNKHDIFKRNVEYEDCINNSEIYNKYLSYINHLKSVIYPYSKNILNTFSKQEFNIYSNIINLTILENKLPNLTLSQFRYIYDNYFKSFDFFKNRIQNYLKFKYPNGFKMDYSIFLELYQLQPELFNEEIENYFKFKFINYNSNIIKVKNVYNEFHKIYPNSSFQGTKYHTNLMINRNQFLKDFISSIKFFNDDDDFTCGLENYYKIYSEYKKIINNYYLLDVPVYKSIFELLNIKIDVKPTLTIEFRKEMYNLFTTKLMSENIYIKYLYVIYMKICMFDTRFIYRNNIYKDNQINYKYKLIHKSYSTCNKIINEYLPFNFTSIQESASEDCIFIMAHCSNIVLTNMFNFNFDTYYYFISAHTNYTPLSKSSKFVSSRVHSYKLIMGSNIERFTPLNIGRYYFKYDSLVEFDKLNNNKDNENDKDKEIKEFENNDEKINIDNDKNNEINNKSVGATSARNENNKLNNNENDDDKNKENKELNINKINNKSVGATSARNEINKTYLTNLRFTTDRNDRKITISDILKYYDLNNWNNKLSSEPLGMLY